MERNLRVFLILVCLTLLVGPQLMAQAYVSSPDDLQLLPEVVWAPATGGGNWVTDIQITCKVGGTTNVEVWYFYGGGNYRGPITVWINPQTWDSRKFTNILSYLQSFDSGFTYYGTSGCLEIHAVDPNVLLTSESRTYNGNLSKSFTSVNFDTDSNRVRWDSSAPRAITMCVLNLDSNSSYRSTLGFFNPRTVSIDIRIFVMDGNTGGYIGSYVDRTLAPYEFLALNPFAACGRPYPTYSYSNMYAYITVGTGYTGTGEAFIFGATSNNYSNDPAGHMGKNYNDPLSPGIASNTGLDNLPEVEPPTVQKNSKK